MPQFIVNGVTVKRENIESQYGMFKSVDLTLQEYGTNTPIVANWYTKQDSPLPAVGATFDGDVSQSEYGLKIKKAQKPGSGGSGWKPKPPEERRSIAMQHAQKCAVTLLELSCKYGEYKPPERVAEMTDHLKAVATSLFKQVVEAEHEPNTNPQHEGQS